VAFESVRPAFWRPGSANIRFAAAIRRRLRHLAPAMVEVHNRPEIARYLARHLPDLPVALLLNNDPQGMRAASTPAERAALLRQLALVMTSSGYLRARFLAGTGAPEDAVAVLPNSIDLAALPPPRPRERLILFAGRIVPEKGPDAFVDACATTLPRLAGWRADLIGADRFHADSPDTQFVRMVRAAAEGAGARSIGYRDHDFVMQSMARAAIVVVPSRWEEPFGLVALEALASGAALIVSRRGGLPEVAGDAALYIDPDEPGSIAAAILTLAQDPTRRAALSEAGRQRARQFDVPVVAERLAGLRRDALAARAGR